MMIVRASRLLVTTILLFSISEKIQGQASYPDSSFIRLTHWVDQETGIENNGLFVGLLYPMVSKSRLTHQFFEEKGWTKGYVAFNSNWYFDVSMVFDIENEQLVIKHPDLGRRDGLAIDMNKVEQFSIHNHHFVQSKDEEKQFYDLLYKGENISLLGKHTKKLKIDKGLPNYSATSNYYLVKKDDSSTLIRFSNKGKIDQVVLNGKELTKKIKKNHRVKPKLSDEKQLVKFVKLLDAEIGT